MKTPSRRQRAEDRLRREIRKELHRQLDDILRLEDPETGLPMHDVLLGHVALGYGLNLGIQVRHPEEDGRAEEDPALRDLPPAPRIEVVPR
jgi:hypothetical protein